ncbi:SDR family NAD(P)-dependent oxidoreductase [Streptomyces sp. NPDC002587]
MTAPLLDQPLTARPRQGRTALVTGGATGIGAATARALAAAGATLALTHYDQIEQARALLGEVRRLGSGGIEVSADLTGPSAVELMASQVASELGPVDIPVNNADAYARLTWHETDEAAWAQALDLTIHYRACHAVTPYATARAGLLGLGRSLARELGPHGICVNRVLPARSRTTPRTASPHTTVRALNTRSPASAYPAAATPRTSPSRSPSSPAPQHPSSLFSRCIPTRLAAPLTTAPPSTRGSTPMKQRVRGILITPRDTTLFMKRIRPDRDPYWVVIGGGIEESDPTPEDALLREIREEIAGEATIGRLFHEFKNPSGETEFFYLAHVTSWNFADRTGPEFLRADRGTYELVEVPLTLEAIAAINLLPTAISDELGAALRRGDLSAAAPQC